MEQSFVATRVLALLAVFKQVYSVSYTFLVMFNNFLFVELKVLNFAGRLKHGGTFWRVFTKLVDLELPFSKRKLIKIATINMAL